MIKNRIVYFSSIIILLVLIFIYENPVTYTALYTALVLPFISLFISIIAKRKFTISENLEEDEIIKGQKTIYNVNVKNNSFLPCTSINVKFFETPYIETLHTQHLFSLGAKKKYDLSFEIEAKHRGVYEIGIDGVVLYDFLGLFSFKQKHLKKLKLIVLPRVLNIDPISLKMATEGIEQSNDYKADEDYSIISDLRKYVPTDGYKKIHWKASAKKNELISKIFGTTKKNSVILILDNRLSNIEKEDEILEAFVSVLNYVSQVGFDVSIAAIGLPVSYGNFSFLYRQVSSISFVSKDFAIYLKDFIKMQTEADNLIIFTQDLTDALIAKAQVTQNNVLIYYTNRSTKTEWANAKHIGEILHEFT